MRKIISGIITLMLFTGCSMKNVESMLYAYQKEKEAREILAKAYSCVNNIYSEGQKMWGAREDIVNEYRSAVDTLVNELKDIKVTNLTGAYKNLQSNLNVIYGLNDKMAMKIIPTMANDCIAAIERADKLLKELEEKK